MDADMIKTSAQDQMEMLTSMMMHLDKLPDFPSAYQQIPEFPDIELSNGSATTATPNTNTTTATFPLTSPPLITPSSFMGPTINGQVGPSFPQNVVCPIESTSAMQKRNSMEAMREMIFRVAMMQPVQIDPESVRPPKRRNVRISKDPQSVAARHRRERISERIRILQRLVPGGTKMDTASMLDEAVHYVKFLKRQVQSLERASEANGQVGFAFPAANYSGFMKSFQPPHIVAGSVQMLR